MNRTLLALSLLACGAEAPVAVDTAEDAQIASVSSALTLGVNVQVSTDPGTRLTLCGKADKALTNAWLAGNGERFVVDYPAGFPGSYWGINPTSDAYVCLDTTQ